MTPTRSLTLAATLLAAAALAAAGCGSSDDGDGGAPAPASNGQKTTIALADTGLGRVLVDAQGRTLYLFEADKGPTSTCTGGCATEWPPLRVSGKPTVGAGLKASLVGTTKRTDGKREVTYAGHPLYLYVGDQKPGDTTGQGIDAFGALWYAVTASGSNASGSASGGGSSVY